ncbi:MAG: prolyl oligopeptidase family serine peptidase [bacterium]
MRRSVLLGVICAGALLAQARFDVHALLRLSRVGDPQLSPDGLTVAFTVQTINEAENSSSTQIWTVPLAGGSPRQLTTTGSMNTRPRWSPDSREIAFISDRSGTPQVWLMAADGSNAHQVTDVAAGADGVIFSPDGENLLFTSEVYPDCPDDACNKARLEQEKNSAVKARSYTSLLYRHWTHWQSKRRRHLFVVPADGGAPKDLTPGTIDVPPFSLGGSDDYAISPDGKEVCFVMNQDAEPAVSTNSDLFVVPIDGGEPTRITINLGADNSPAYSPDGRYLAWRTQQRSGYESDRWKLAVLERATGRLSILTDAVDRWITSFRWSPDSSMIFMTVEDRGRQYVQVIPSSGGGARSIISGDSSIDDLQVTPDGKTLVFTEASGSRPPEIFKAVSGGAATQLTHFNDAALAAYNLPRLEEFWVQAPDRTRIHSFFIRPHGFREGRRYPVLFLIHGGPQGAWGESWSYRWNAQLFAAAGYLVVMPNPRGSTGYGQQFIDEINQDWGGRPFDDIMAVVEHVARLPYADPDRMAAAGASYGGYMVNWILGHTNRFKALVSHAGVFDLRSMFGETEELWFPLWEFGGAPWENPEIYARWSPSYYASSFATPTLVTHGEMDFRVPYGQGLQLFTALQLRRVPSKLLVFPDEGHWITKPQNSVLWYDTVLEWLGEWLNKPAQAAPAAPATGQAATP